MQPKVREALEASIKHWEENVAAESPAEAHVWADHCALCAIFNSINKDSEEEDCIDQDYGTCPVLARTGEDQCGNSPWEKAQVSHLRWAKGLISKEEWREAARAELAFLRSLLPED